MDIELAKNIIKAVNSTEMETVGSRTIPGAAKPDSDHDILIYSNQYRNRWGTKKVVAKLFELGFKPDANGKQVKDAYGQTRTLPGYGTGVFDSFRKGDINLIITGNKEFYNKFLTANKLAIAMGLTDRTQRVTLFKYILYGEMPDVFS